jgi:hypothetical protein
MIPLHIFGGAVLTDQVAGAIMTAELQAADLEFVLMPGVEVTIVYVLYTNDGVCVMQERVTSIEVAPTGGRLSYVPMAYLDWRWVPRSPGPFLWLSRGTPCPSLSVQIRGNGRRETW